MLTPGVAIQRAPHQAGGGRRIAVVGAGVSGLSAAWLLAKAHDVTLFEREQRLGGHANTVEVPVAEGRIAVDTGFIVYNVASYPNLVAMFEHFGIETIGTRMTFAASLDGGRCEYSGTGIHGMFGRPGAWLDPEHWRMTRDILRFFREADAFRHAARDEALSLGDWLVARRYSRAFIERHILPMAAAIWSAPADTLLAYPAASFSRFFANHGLLQVRNRPQWRTVVDGSRSYVRRLLSDFGGAIRPGSPVVTVVPQARGVDLVLADGRRETFEQVVLACHADQALRLRADPDADERALLGAFRYQSNDAVLHTDPRLMPQRRRLWSSWNYIGVGRSDRLCVSYWMNALQSLKTRTDLFVTLNPPAEISPEHEIARFAYDHPVFDAAALAAQRDLWRIQGRRGIWFAGAYCGAGFHEDGLQAGLWVAESIGGVQRPWQIAAPSDRIVTGPPLDRRSLVEAVA
jgi:predicted NAD/FAD-binding protein